MKSKELFNKYLSALIIPAIVFLFFLYLYITIPDGWMDLVFAIYFIVIGITVILHFIFLLINKKTHLIRINWWKNIIISVIILIIVYLGFVIYVRI